ncbi:hypothetical protein [Aquimarina algicola]|uniref:Uncharacterized protein n=1 Tax=Aquimarina algicola TaxID=2589995 RepID=A0A504JHL8_9FLAO|nr:hypothetical protein [Aquimarina algicola]TPN87143.1 hypothetical protein FHK87_06000 [Aquimarina algicola]
MICVLRIDEFLKLSEEEQFKSIWKDGTHIDTIIKTNSKLILYSLYKFYVQLTYDRKRNRIIDKEVFNEGKLLDPFIENIEL